VKDADNPNRWGEPGVSTTEVYEALMSEPTEMTLRSVHSGARSQVLGGCGKSAESWRYESDASDARGIDAFRPPRSYENST
jgi:hypothetical protein